MSTSTTLDPSTLFGSVADTVNGFVSGAATEAIPVGLGIVALFIGWRLVKRFVRG